MPIMDLDDLIRKFEKMEKDFPEIAELFLKTKAEEVKKETKKLTPVKDGILRNAWHRKKIGPLKQVIYNNTNYAAHVEYGHRIVKNKKAVGYVRGRYMLKRGMNKANSTFLKDLDTVFKNLFER